jgi:sulfate/thiosulfate transport system ATP-binding protein
MTVRIAGLSRHYGNAAALAGIDLDIAEGEFLALLGPSCAGKTTLLRLIAGLDRPDAGTIEIDAHDIRRLAPCDRRIGFVFQNYALFRHMTVARNIAFGLSVRPRRERPSRARIAARIAELLDLMQLSGLGDRFPAQLSGGQRQRVALARALALDPKVLLLDEPFGALDAKVRAELREWLHALQRKLRLTTIFVTHDQAEAFLLADRIAIINAGRLEQVGTSAEISDRPASAFVGEFLGAHRRSNGDRLDARAPAAAPRECQPALNLMPVPRQSAAGHYSCRRGALMEQALLDRPPTSASDTTARAQRSATEHWPKDLHRANPILASDLPAIGPGECWFLMLPAKAELVALERHALTTANVIVYDRALAKVATAILPLGGYAEPAAGDGLERCINSYATAGAL